jgi:hypothetical protein
VSLSPARYSLDQLGEDGKLERLLDEGSRGPVDKLGQRRRCQVAGGEDEAGKEIGTVLG